MSKICIYVPDTRDTHTVGLEVTLDGLKKVATYRVESVPLPVNVSTAERVNRLREYVRGYPEGWELVQIGPSVRDVVPITFRRTG